MRMGALTALVASLACAATSPADTRVELIGRVDFNGLALGNCFNPPCPWQHVRPGEYVHVTFLVDDVGHDISAGWPPCNPPRVIGDVVYDILDGTMVARAADVSLGIPVGTTDSGYTSPAFRMVSDNCTVDAVEIGGALLGRGGRCCYPNGSCTYVSQENCAGVWTIEGVCRPDANGCAPVPGACCAFDDTCTMTLAADCVGTWSFGACTAGLCPQTVGACCDPDGSCAITAAPNCVATWTEGGVCGPDTCPAPTLLPDYAMDLTLRGPTTMFSSAVVTENLGYYPPSTLAPDHSWTVLFQSNEMFIYPGTAIALSTDTTPMGSCCPGDGHCLVTTRAICPVQSSWVMGGSCLPTTCPSGSGACCKADGTCDLLTTGACAGFANAVYQGNGTACNPGVCPPTGACCADGSCAIVIQSACVATGGSWLGGGTACAVQPQYSVALGTVAGRCCYPNGSCEVKYQTVCTGVGNTFAVGQLCDVPCENAGACCNFHSGQCAVVTQAACDNVGGTWIGSATCDNACADAGVCCNTVAGTCTVVPQAACQFGNVWSQGGTCDVPCTPGTGACCNTADGSCRVTTQTFCTGAVAWTAGATCAAPCVGGAAILPDAVFNGPSGVWTNTIDITDPSTVRSVEVWMDISTSRLNDLKVRLTGPNGTTVDLFTRVDAKPPLCVATPVGAGHTMFGVYSFSDAAPQSFYDHIIALGLGSGAPTVPGRYRAAGCGGTPVSLNATFGGIPAAGNWSLTIIDERDGISASLKRWGLSFNGGTPAPCTIGRCMVGTNCTATTFAQCGGDWSIGPCSPVSCSSGAPGACCFLDVCAVMCPSLCPTAGGALFAGSGTACSPTVCLSACCRADGACIMTTPTDCSGIAGAAGSTCSPNACPAPAACCLPNGECIVRLASACTGGTPGPAGSGCSPNTCSNPNPAPANDACATVLAAGPDVVLSGDLWSSGPVTMLGARADAQVPTCGGGSPAADVWWRFIPPTSGAYLISTCGNPVWDTTVSVWSNCTTQVTGACADDNCSTSTVYGHENLTTPLTAGTPYLIRVGSFAPTTANPGDFTLSVSALGACCNTAGACSLTTQAACVGARIFQGTFTVCSPSPCPQPRACCTSQNSCLFVVLSACTGDNTPGPEGSTCSPNPCGQPTACCHPDGACEFTYWPLCTGDRQQFGSVCDPNPCPQPNGACCAGSTCTVASPESCTGANTSFSGAGTVCNAFGVNNTSPCCLADYNHAGGVTVQDIFDFLAGYFTFSPQADINGAGGVTVQDIFDFLGAYFTGC